MSAPDGILGTHKVDRAAPSIADWHLPGTQGN
jgi:hypothetical protein